MADHLNNKPFGAWIAIDIATISVPDKDKVITPNMIGMSSSQPHTAAIVKPESASRRLLLWDL